MAEITRDQFPPNVLRRLQTPINRRKCVSNLSVARDRSWGGILYPVSQMGGR